MARHARSFERDQTFINWQHYIELVQTKPGALRNGAPFKTMPEALHEVEVSALSPWSDILVLPRALAERLPEQAVAAANTY